MKKELWNKNLNAFSIVEVLAAIAILSTFIVTVGAAIVRNVDTASESNKQERAVFLAEEGLEAVRAIRNEDFSLLIDGDYGINKSNSIWSFIPDSDSVEDYTRTITIGTIDQNTRQIDSKVSWTSSSGQIKEVYLSSQLRNIYRVVQTEGSWSNPQILATYNIDGSNAGYDIEVAGNYAYIMTNTGIAIVDITDQSNPLKVSDLAVSGSPTGMFLANNTIYLSTNRNQEEVAIIDVSNPLSPALITTYDLPGNREARDLVLDGNILYIIKQQDKKEDEVFALDISNPLSIVLLDSLNINTELIRIVNADGYVYISSQANNAEVNIINVSNPSNLGVTNTINLPGNSDGYTLSIDGQNLIISQSSGILRIYDISNSNIPVLISTYNAGAVIEDIEVVSSISKMFLATQNNTQELQIIDTSNISNLTLFGSHDHGNDLFGVSYHGDFNKAFAVSDDTINEFVVYQPQ